MAVLRGGRCRRHRCNDRHRTDPGAHWGAALLLRRLLPATLLPATGLLCAGVLPSVVLLRATLGFFVLCVEDGTLVSYRPEIPP